jgi:hypothetical protein
MQHAGHEALSMKEEIMSHDYASWDKEVDACTECGRRLEHPNHTLAHGMDIPVAYRSYEDALWKWVLANGYMHSVYGGEDPFEKCETLKHLKTCQLNLSVSLLPRITNVEEFMDSDGPNKLVEVSAASLTCECGDIYNQNWVMPDNMTLGEIIFKVVKAGETR